MKKCAVINDISGFGKCSLSVSLPILSVCGIEAHPLPIAVLSNQTAYNSYSMVSLTDHLQSFISEWEKLNVKFDAILTGFVCNEEQIDIIIDFIDRFKEKDTLIIVDPVMADNGNLYDGYTKQMCNKIKKLSLKADIITPNVAELSFLADEPYSEKLEDIIRYCKKLKSLGYKKVVVTGLKSEGKISNIVYDDCVKVFSTEEKGGYYSGTGDIFASVITSGLLNDLSLDKSTNIATNYIKESIDATDVINHNDGINFEKLLYKLGEKIKEK